MGEHVENMFFLPNYTTLQNALICVIEMLLSEYQAANKPKPPIKLIKKVEK